MHALFTYLCVKHETLRVQKERMIPSQRRHATTDQQAMAQKRRCRPVMVGLNERPLCDNKGGVRAVVVTKNPSLVYNNDPTRGKRRPPQVGVVFSNRAHCEAYLESRASFSKDGAAASHHCLLVRANCNIRFIAHDLNRYL